MPPILPGLSSKGIDRFFRMKALSTRRVSDFISAKEIDETEESEDTEVGRSAVSPDMAMGERHRDTVKHQPNFLLTRLISASTILWSKSTKGNF